MVILSNSMSNFTAPLQSTKHGSNRKRQIADFVLGVQLTAYTWSLSVEQMSVTTDAVVGAVTLYRNAGSCRFVTQLTRDEVRRYENAQFRALPVIVASRR